METHNGHQQQAPTTGPIVGARCGLPLKATCCGWPFWAVAGEERYNKFMNNELMWENNSEETINKYGLLNAPKAAKHY